MLRNVQKVEPLLCSCVCVCYILTLFRVQLKRQIYRLETHTGVVCYAISVCRYMCVYRGPAGVIQLCCNVAGKFALGVGIIYSTRSSLPSSLTCALPDGSSIFACVSQRCIIDKPATRHTFSYKRRLFPNFT